MPVFRAWRFKSSLGVIVGPLISGTVLQIWHWRGIFILNVVMAAIAFTGAAALVPESRDPHPRRLDVLGALLAGVGLFGISYAVIHSSSDISPSALIGVQRSAGVHSERHPLHRNNGNPSWSSPAACQSHKPRQSL